MKPDIFQALRDFSEDRPVMKEANSDLDFMVGLLLQEVAELQEEPHGMSKKDYLIQEASDVAIFAIGILNILTEEPEMAIMEKVARNMAKYNSKDFQNGTYDDARKKSKAIWTEMRNKEFYSIDK